MKKRAIQNLLYRLRKDNSTVSGYLINESTEDRVEDAKTGEYAITYDSKKLRKIVILPLDHFKHFVYDLSFIAANKNFTTGGYYDRNDTIILVDNTELGDFVISQDSKFQIEGKLFEVNKFTDVYNLSTLVSLHGIKTSDILIEES